MGYRDIYKQNTERYLHLIDAVSGVYKKVRRKGESDHDRSLPGRSR